MNNCYMLSTFSFAGLMFDGVLDTETGESFLSLTSTAAAIKKPASSTSEFLKSKQPEAKPYKGFALRKIRFGAKTVTLVPTAAAAAFYTYWSRKGNQEAIDLLTSTFQADIDRSVKESNGSAVTAAQHEENRATIRHELVQARLQVNIDYEVESARITELAEAVESEEEYEATIVPLWDALRARKKAVEAVRLTEDEYAAYVSLESQRR